ncbi:MAG: hypothetical protein JXN59_09815 [Anaerolineae bacterium]|nr:hypothetical protein [Anaerolineae bacterium]
MPDELNALATFVLDTVAQLRAITGEQAAEPALNGVHIREITFSIPYDPGSRHLLIRGASHFEPAAQREPALRLPQAVAVLRALGPDVAFERARLVSLPEQELARLEITIRL